VSTRLLLPLCCLLAFVLAVVVALGPLGGMPHVSDEVSYTLQSRLFAAGMRAGPAADVPSALQYPFWVVWPLSYSPFPIGWPLLLSLGERVGLPWLVNPLLAGLLPLLAWLLGREWATESEARLAALVAALSPGVWLLSGSRMSHTGVLVGLGVALVVVARGRDRTLAWGLAAFGVAYVVLARPYDAVLVGGPLLAFGLWRAPGLAARLLLVGLPGLAAALVLWDNNNLTGSALQFPMELYFKAAVPDRPGCDALGFGADRRCFGPLGWAPSDAAQVAAATLQRLDRGLLGLPGGSLLALWGAWALRRWEPLALAAVVILGHALYWSPGVAYGARFWHPLYLVLPVLIAVGAQRLLRRFGPLVLIGVPLASAPLWFGELGDRYFCVDEGLRDALTAEGITEGVVFLRAKGQRSTSWPTLGVPELSCDAQLEAGDGFALLDPTQQQGGLQLRHALPDAELLPYLARFQPDASAWLVLHDVETDQRELLRLDRAP
jgi:hypothetical protein